jgi:hypothetical protein
MFSFSLHLSYIFQLYIQHLILYNVMKLCWFFTFYVLEVLVFDWYVIVRKFHSRFFGRHISKWQRLAQLRLIAFFCHSHTKNPHKSSQSAFRLYENGVESSNLIAFWLNSSCNFFFTSSNKPFNVQLKIYC